MKYKIITHGCQMNEHDSERIAALLEDMGYTRTEKEGEADFLLLNTCLVRENAEQKVFGQLGALKKWRAEKADRVLAVSGCMMQTGPAQETIKKTYPQVDLVFGTQNIGKLPQLLAQHKERGERVFDTGRYEEDLPHYRRMQDRFAYVNIMTGCNNFCSYCVVPYARGREQSRPAREILDELARLGRRGYREVMLLGQNVNSYRDPDYSFPQLLAAIHDLPGLERIRFLSSHPKDLSDELIQVMATHPKIERHFHLPLQSGSNKVLKEMRRVYSREHFMERAQALRAAMPDISLTTDIIVGFPGETEEDHQQTLDLCRQLEFDSAFTFLYSPRPGTKAAERKDQVDAKTASRRFQELLDVLYPIFLKKNQAEVGSTVEVLLESPSKNDPDRISGRDSKGKLVHVKADSSQIGEMVSAKITGANSFSLLADLA